MPRTLRKKSSVKYVESDDSDLMSEDDVSDGEQYLDESSDGEDTPTEPPVTTSKVVNENKSRNSNVKKIRKPLKRKREAIESAEKDIPSNLTGDKKLEAKDGQPRPAKKARTESKTSKPTLSVSSTTSSGPSRSVRSSSSIPKGAKPNASNSKAGKSDSSSTVFSQWASTRVGVFAGRRPTLASIRATQRLFDQGNTVPFISRYRKDVIGGFSEEFVIQIQKLLESFKSLCARRNAILKSMEKSGKLTESLRMKLVKCGTLTELEDIFLPFRPAKRKTRAAKARELGLEPVARLAYEQRVTDLEWLRAFGGVDGRSEKMAGASDIVAEWISEDSDIRSSIRQVVANCGKLCSQRKKATKATKSTAKNNEKSKKPQKSRETDPEKFRDYFDFSQPLSRIPSHRILAIDRGESLGILSASIKLDNNIAVNVILSKIIRIHPLDAQRRQIREFLEGSVADCFSRLLFPSLEREARKNITSKAHSEAIDVFSENLKKLLLSRPISGKRVLGIDPGYRSGCKLCVIDETGKLLEIGPAIFPHPPQSQSHQALEIICSLARKHSVSLIAIGNGTASAPTAKLVSQCLKRLPPDCRYIIASEAGASVWSVSEDARKEFPKLEASQRGAISISRRVIDPLAELVKIEPKSIGVGMYQHDLAKTQLATSLSRTVEHCVSWVGADVNTASPALLAHIPGLGPGRARAIAEGTPFRARSDLRKVAGIGPHAYQQAAGFLRVRGGDNLLDNTLVHPENYKHTKILLSKLKVPLSLMKSDHPKLVSALTSLAPKDIVRLATEIEVGELTLKDIVAALKKPGLDPRTELPPPVLRSGILSLSDLKIGTIMADCVVTNVVRFGCFVDIGVGQDALLHNSEMSDKRFIRAPSDIGLAIGIRFSARILNVDVPRKRISLSIKGVPQSDSFPK
eukprot:218131_1